MPDYLLKVNQPGIYGLFIGHCTETFYNGHKLIAATPAPSPNKTNALPGKRNLL